MNAWQRKQRLAALERDQGRCALCGIWVESAPVGHVLAGIAHIVPRSSDPRTWHISNMALLCPACHAVSHTQAGRARILLALAARHGYAYDEQPWKGIVAAYGPCFFQG
jgi:5-methylcytosine-specific restriction endonuclease McrA